MNRTVVALVAAGVAISAGAAAWQVAEPVDAAINAKIRDEALNRSQVAPIFNMLVDTIGPRLTASPAHKRAAEFMRDTATKYGLTNARLEPFEFGRGWELDKLTIEMIEPRYMPLLGYAEAWSPKTSGELVVPAVSIAGKSADDVRAMSAQLKGAAILQSAIVTNFIAADRRDPMLPPLPAAPPAGGRGRGAGGITPKDLQDAGAVVLLRPSRGMQGTVFVAAANRESTTDQLPKIVLAGEHYNLVSRLLQQNISVKLRVNLQSRFLEDRQTYNVLAEIPGTDPALKSQIVMMGAHLDSWHAGTGATDNADGAVVALEAFRILKTIGAQPKRTLRLAIWSGEEEGLLGSKAYVRDHLDGDAHKAGRDQMDVYFNMDPGKGKIYGWYLENNEAVRPIFDAWLAPFKDLGAVRNVPQGIGSTDHLSFIAAGVPGFNPIQDYVDYDIRLHHTNADTSERVDLQDLRQNAVIIASFLYHAANRAEMIPTTIRK
ncbi:MAG TPA: M20/M25/M40 family metallo-hydrolase [Vicinamibacterales bacterium]|nr:M20/M25/M40 family metallo-hydrolase [Vicinamibacterales bacterium]